MFRVMRRPLQALSLEETVQILSRGTSGVLAVSGDDDYPYAVPLSYVYHDQKIYFHGARSGHKLDAIVRNDKVSFCVVDQDRVVPDEITTYFCSVVVFGKARIVEEELEVRKTLELLALKYAPDLSESSLLHKIELDMNHLCIIELTVEHMSGKESIELKQNRSDILITTEMPIIDKSV